MKILKILDKAELILVDLEVNLGKEVRNAPTLCVRYKGKIIPLNTAHDGRPILMNEENAIPIQNYNYMFTGTLWIDLTISLILLATFFMWIMRGD